MNIKKTLIAVGVAFVLGAGGFVALNHFSSSSQQVEATPEQKAKVYDGLHKQLEEAVTKVTETFKQDSAKQTRDNLDAAVQDLRATVKDYVAKKNGGTSDADLAPIAKHFAETVVKTKPLVVSMFKLSGEQYQTIQTIPMLLNQIDHDRFAAEAENLQKLVEPAAKDLTPMVAGQMMLSPLVSRVNQKFAGQKQSGIEVSDAEEQAEYVTQATSLLNNIAAQVKAQPPAAPEQPAPKQP